jgi:hypothetical protein
MKLHHTSWYWFAVVAVTAVALFTLNEAHGQSTGPKAVFEGRPAMAGAQAGQGPMAGPPQGGLSTQSTEDARGGIPLRKKPTEPDGNGPNVPRDPGLANPAGGELKPQPDRDPGNVIKRDREGREGISDQGHATGKAKRAAKRTYERAKRGVSGVDS